MKLNDTIPLWGRAPRTSLCALLAIALLVAVWLVSPAQLPIVLYKAALASLGGVIGYFLDRVFFPYARPDSYLVYDWRLGSTEPEGNADFPVAPDHMPAFCAAMQRRALIVVGTAVCICLGL